MSTAQVRHHWADFARGACVVLVVLHHVVRQLVTQSNPNPSTALEVWSWIDSFLTPVRIPLFFFVSGMLSRKALSRDWRPGALRFWTPLYLYVGWSTLLALRELLNPEFSITEVLTNIALVLAFASSGYWYLLALPVYYLATRLTNPLPLTPVLLASAVLYFCEPRVSDWFRELARNLVDQPSVLGSLLGGWFFFLLGARTNVEERFKHLGAPSIGLLLLAFGCVSVINVSTDSTIAAAAASLVAIPLGVALARRLAPSDGSGTLSRIGTRTLPVYVLQFFFISVISLAFTRLAAASDVLENEPIVALLPAGLTAMIVGISLFMHSLLKRRRLTASLFEIPAFAATRLTRPKRGA